MTTVATEAPATPAATAPVAGARFTVGSRPQRRYSDARTVDITNGGTSFPPMQLPATGYVRKVALDFDVNLSGAGAFTLASGDAPFNLITGITITDASGQPVVQPISGYSLYLVNKYFATGDIMGNRPTSRNDPFEGPDYDYSVGATTAHAHFRLDLEFEVDSNTGYGCIANLDSNASLQLKIDVAPYTNAFAGTATSATVSLRVSQWYWAPVGQSINGVPVQNNPIGLGDYVETRYETQTVNPGSENLIQVVNRGGLIRGMIMISRDSTGARVAFTPKSNVGLILDNNPIDEGITLEEHNDANRRTYDFLGADLTSYAPLATKGLKPGLDVGTLVWNYAAQSGGRDSWLQTRVGSLLQARITPGSGASSLEIVSLLAQVGDASAFYGSSALG